MKENQRELLRTIFKQIHNSSSAATMEAEAPTLNAEKLSYVGCFSGSLFGTHGQGISAQDIQNEAKAVGLGQLSRLAANKIASFLNQNKNIGQTIIQATAQQFVRKVLSPILSAEADSDNPAAQLFLDLAKKDNPQPRKNWMFNLMLGLLCVSPLAMFAALGGANMVCGDKNERDCSDTTKLLMEGLFGVLFGLGSVALTGMFTAFSMESPRDRDMIQWTDDTFQQSRLRSVISSSRYYLGELSLGIISSAGMMMFITKTLRFLVEKIQNSNEIDSHSPTLVTINSILLLIASYACIRGNTNNIHNLHQRIYQRDWKNLLYHMRSFDHKTRKELSQTIQTILDDKSKEADAKYKEIIKLILSKPKGNVMSDGGYYASLTVGALILAISAYAQYFIAGCDAVPYFEKVLTGQIPPDINVSTPENFVEGLFGAGLTATNFMVMLNSLICYLKDQFLVGATDKEKEKTHFYHRVLASLLALMPAGAAVSQVFVLNPSTSLALKIWEIVSSIANGGQAWLFGVVGALFVIKKCSESSACCAGNSSQSRSIKSERSPLLRSEGKEEEESTSSSSAEQKSPSTVYFDAIMHAIEEAYTQSSCNILFPLSADEISACKTAAPPHTSDPAFRV